MSSPELPGGPLWPPAYNAPPLPELPRPYAWPEEFRALVQQPLAAGLDPWSLLLDWRSSHYLGKVAGRWPSHRFLPFAHDMRSDEIVCFDLDEPPLVQLVDDPLAQEFIERTFASLQEWLHFAVDDALAFWLDELRFDEGVPPPPDYFG